MGLLSKSNSSSSLSTLDLELSSLLDDDKPLTTTNTTNNSRSSSSRHRSNFSTLISIYLYISPIGILYLLFTLYYNPTLTSSFLNKSISPYACKPKSLFTSLSNICQSAGNNLNREEVDKYELGIDRHLTQDQCDSIFPGLYLEADRARDYYKSKGGVNLIDLDEAEKLGNARAMIYNNRLYIKSYSKLQQGTRTKATLAAINEALITSLEPLPDVEFVLQTGDSGIVSGAPWVLGRKAAEEGLVLIPDYGFFSWPEPAVNSFLEVQDNTLLYEAELTWSQKIPKLFWKGATMVPIRVELMEIAAKYSWGAVSDIVWANKTAVLASLLTPEQHCKFKFLGHAEGFAYSGRLKYLQQCRSVVVAHELEYIQHFHHLFNSDPTSPLQNIVISPGRNFDELPETMANLLGNDERSELIANNSFTFFRHWLSPASIDCYWRRLIIRWAEVQNFEPTFSKDFTSYNSFILLGKTHWIPY